MSPDRDTTAQTSSTSPLLEDERALLAAVARAHYLEGLSRTEIAEKFDISRFKVARLLARAREKGIVKIEINDWGLPDPILGRRLKDELGLVDCRVVRSHGDEDAVRDQIGEATARVLSETLKEDEFLGVAWGRTLTATTAHLDHLPRVSIVQLTGFIAGDLESSPVAVAQQASMRSGGVVHPIFAPLLAQDPETAKSLRNHPDIRRVMNLFPSISTALLSVGSWSPPNSQIRAALSAREVAAAETHGCVADIAGILVNDDGTPADPGFQEHCVTISYEELRKIPRVLAVAGGVGKAAAIRAVARGGLITELVTDHALALAILGEDSD
jgi:DNA-binding transcriptional regulator LsrR (DeoR family)